MRTLVCIALCALTAPVWAGGYDGTVMVSSMTVKDRILTLELINVTAEKPVAEEAEPLDQELEQVLAEAESLEATDGE